MGRLLNSDSGQVICLKTMHALGRDPSLSDTLLTNPLCSRLQCVLQYQAGTWSISDKSKNGTYLNNQKLQTNNNPLVEGDTISFPGEDDVWKLIDANQPGPMLVQNVSHQFIELTSINLLPDESNPELILTLQANNWIVEQGKNVHQIKGGETIKFDGKEWCFHPNDQLEETVTQLYSPETNGLLRLHFDISLNEENVRLLSTFNGVESDLGYKSHHLLLLSLARHRVLDEERKTPNREQGWLATDVLLIELGIEPNHLNILIYRLRKAFEALGYPDMLIERRQGEIRLCACNLSLRKGDELLEQHCL